jgi:hypothetical protein
MFIENKYSSWYFAIVKHYQNDPPIEQYEVHHIIPKSLGGNNDTSNLVKLPCKAHFICHHLLTKMTDGIANSKMTYAYSLFIHTSKNRGIKVTASQYAKVKTLAWDANRKEKQSILCSEQNSKNKRKPREERRYECHQCGNIFTLIEMTHHARKEKAFCSRICICKYSATAPRGKQNRTSPAWNKGRANPHAAVNGKKGADALSNTAKGRKRKYLDDGSWTWCKPS